MTKKDKEKSEENRDTATNAEPEANQNTAEPEAGQSTSGQNPFGAKKLYRSTSDQMIGGVCGGLADYFNIDVTIIRIVFAAMFFAGGTGFLAYIIAWMIIPEDNVIKEPVHKQNSHQRSGHGSSIMGMVIGCALLFIGAGMLFDNLDHYFFMPRWFRNVFSMETLLGVILIGAGVFVVMKMFNQEEKDPGSPSPNPGDTKKDNTSSYEGNYSKGFSFDGSKTLYKSKYDKKVCGICGGLADYFNIDVTIVRVIFLVFIFATGLFPGLFVYFIMCAVIPEAPMINGERS